MQRFGYSNVWFCQSLFFPSRGGQNVPKICTVWWPSVSRENRRTTELVLTDRQDGWMDGWWGWPCADTLKLSLCRRLSVPPSKSNPSSKKGFERKNAQLYLNMRDGEIWQRGGGFKSCFGNVQIDGTLFKNKNTEAAQKCPIVFEHAGRGGSWQRLRFRVFALERLMLWKWEAALQFTEVTEPFAWTDQKSYVSNQLSYITALAHIWCM